MMKSPHFRCLLVFLAMTSAKAANHPELFGEQPDQADIGPGDMRCSDGFPKGRCLSYCHGTDQVATCFAGGVCLCVALVERAAPAPGRSRVMEELAAEAAGGTARLHDMALGAGLVYLAVVGLLLHARRRCRRTKTSPSSVLV